MTGFKAEIAKVDGVMGPDDPPVDPPEGIRWLTAGTLTGAPGTGKLFCASCFVSEGAIHRDGCKVYPTHHTDPTGSQPTTAERAD